MNEGIFGDFFGGNNKKTGSLSDAVKTTNQKEKYNIITTNKFYQDNINKHPDKLIIKTAVNKLSTGLASQQEVQAVDNYVSQMANEESGQMNENKNYFGRLMKMNEGKEESEETPEPESSHKGDFRHVKRLAHDVKSGKKKMSSLKSTLKKYLEDNPDKKESAVRSIKSVISDFEM